MFSGLHCTAAGDKLQETQRNGSVIQFEKLFVSETADLRFSRQVWNHEVELKAVKNMIMIHTVITALGISHIHVYL